MGSLIENFIQLKQTLLSKIKGLFLFGSIKRAKNSCQKPRSQIMTNVFIIWEMKGKGGNLWIRVISLVLLCFQIGRFSFRSLILWWNSSNWKSCWIHTIINIVNYKLSKSFNMKNFSSKNNLKIIIQYSAHYYNGKD